MKEQCRVRVHLPHPDQRHSHTQRKLKKEAAPCRMAYEKLGCCNKDLHLDTGVGSEILTKQQREWGDVWTEYATEKCTKRSDRGLKRKNHSAHVGARCPDIDSRSMVLLSTVLPMTSSASISCHQIPSCPRLSNLHSTMDFSCQGPTRVLTTQLPDNELTIQSGSDSHGWMGLNSASEMATDYRLVIP